ncbi:hypothetical protein [Alicycliphilus denitrificans]|uniref:hypothetical protein n=1 Tax=Alicycliphilus denitrificans TaxID=179636 RepID=UPI0011C36E65|nr:hypothetical protein [Alicycliphilus denitrificans]
MAQEPTKSRGGGKLSRSEITTVRLDPKLRYLAELAARKQRRTLSSFIEWAIEDTLGRVALREGPDWLESVGAQAQDLWDVDPADRLAKLAFRYPELLTHDEQVLWKLVRENGALWKGRFGKSSKDWEWDVRENTLLFARLREHFPAFLAVVAGVQPATVLPRWHKNEAEQMAARLDDMDLNVFE